MGMTFWLLFVLQLLILVAGYRLIFKVEKDRPTETIIPETDNDVEIF